MEQSENNPVSDARITGHNMMMALIEQYANEQDENRKRSLKLEVASGVATLFAHAIPDGTTSASTLFERCQEAVSSVLPELADDADTPAKTVDAVRAAMGAYSVLRNQSAKQRQRAADALLRLKDVLRGKLHGIPQGVVFERIDEEVRELSKDPQKATHSQESPSTQSLNPTENVLEALHKPFQVRCQGVNEHYISISCSQVDGEAAMTIKTREGTALISETQARMFFGFDMGRLPHSFAKTPIHMQWNESWQNWSQVDAALSMEPGVVTFGPLPSSSNPSALELDGHRFQWWFTATTPMRQAVVSEVFYVERQNTGVDYIDLMRQSIDNVRTNTIASKDEAPQQFAKLYWSPEHGQILILLDSEEDGAPVLKICAQPSSEVCAYPMRFGPNSEAAKAAAQATFNSFTIEKARTIADEIFALNS